MHYLPNVAATALARHNLPLLRPRGAAIRRMVAAFAMCATSALPLDAAEIKLGPDLGVVIEGNIETGDYDKLLSFIKDNDIRNSIFLASPGGNVAEAIKIGRLVRMLRMATEIPGQFSREMRDAMSPDDLNKRLLKSANDHNIRNREDNYVCASACFFVFVAGVYRDKEPSVYDEPSLGIHRPFLTDSDLTSLSASEAMASAKQLRAFIESYFKEMDVPSKYADLMFSVPREQVRWIDDTNFEFDLEGFIPELKDWIDARCDKRTAVEKVVSEELKDKPRTHLSATEKKVMELLDEEEFERLVCEDKAREELSREAKLKMFTEQK